jgi:glucan phosphoethanolaminetransferase (alkaline phosphatase superfamily)
MKKFSFVFTKEEAIEYYTYLISSSTSNRLKQLFFMLSVPLLLVLTAVFFKLNHILVIIILSIVSIFWLMIIFPRFWKVYIKSNVGEKFLEKNNLTNFEKVNVEIDDSRMVVNDKEYILKDAKLVKTKSLFIFFFPRQPIAIPRRIINK